MTSFTYLRPEVIFFGNGPLADYTLAVLEKHCDIIFHAHTKDDLEQVKTLKREHPDAFGILASFGVMVKSDVLDLFEPTGILNIHPSLLPDLRGASPIESAILRGDTSFSVSIMKLVRAMDAGPLYHQITLDDLPLDKDTIYRSLATAGATWLTENFYLLPTPTPQSGEPTFCGKFDKSLSLLTPETKSSEVLMREIIAYKGFPKSKIALYGHELTILEAHTSDLTVTALSHDNPLMLAPSASEPYLYTSKSSLALLCADGHFLFLDRVQPAGKNPMDARSFLNGYAK